ncbi:MAG: BadF/BadG/BcrA/BcrD ATPase family protein, partial [Planctomycetota bacterium]
MMTAETSRKGPRFVLGVDGGGSKTVAVIAVRESGIEVPSEIARAETGPSNALTSDQATLNVAEAISRARKQAHQCLAAEFQIECACLSLAGTGRKGMLDVWNSWVESNNIASHVVITDDIAPILRQCSADGIALAVIAGTGSIAVGRKNDGSRVRCGGWGPMFSDEGSGYD